MIFIFLHYILRVWLSNDVLTSDISFTIIEIINWFPWNQF